MQAPNLHCLFFLSFSKRDGSVVASQMSRLRLTNVSIGSLVSATSIIECACIVPPLSSSQRFSGLLAAHRCCPQVQPTGPGQAASEVWFVLKPACSLRPWLAGDCTALRKAGCHMPACSFYLGEGKCTRWSACGRESSPSKG